MAAIGSDLPICPDRNRAWSASEAKQRVAKWASSDGSGDKDTISWDKYSRAFLWRDSAGDDNFGDFKLPFADVENGELEAIWKGVASAAGVVQGSMGGAHIPAADEEHVKHQIDVYYKKAAKEFKDDSIKAPWRSTDPRLAEFESRFGVLGGLETRTFPFVDVEVRDSGAGDDQYTITGYAAVYNSASLDLGGFTERISPGAFDKVLASNPEVHALINHDFTKVLGTTSNRTLDLRDDPERGLRYWVRPAPTSYAKDLRILLDRKDVQGASFRFVVGDDTWETSGPEGEGEITRTITEVSELSDVTVCAQGAYPAATSEVVRSYVRDYANSRVEVPQSVPEPVVEPEAPKAASKAKLSAARARAKRARLSA